MKAYLQELKKMTMENWSNQMSQLMDEFGEVKNRQVTNTEFKSKNRRT